MIDRNNEAIRYTNIEMTKIITSSGLYCVDRL